MKALIIGASNLDIFASTQTELIKSESLPGSIHLGFGGVGRNICENLAHLNVECIFVSLLGDDVISDSLYNYMEKLDVNMNYVRRVSGYPMSMYMAILDANYDMQYAINDMKLAEQFTINDIDVISHSDYDQSLVILDTNLDDSIISHVFEKYRDQRIAVDCISANKARKLVEHLSSISYLKCNIYEAQSLLEQEIITEQDKLNACLKLVNLGVEQVIITDGEKDIVYNDGLEIKKYHITPLTKIVNATGAGDAFFSGYLLGVLEGKDNQLALKYGCDAAKITLLSNFACTSNIKEIKEICHE